MKFTHRPSRYTEASISPGLRRFAWLNVSIQAALPLLMAFSPVMASPGEQQFSQHAELKQAASAPASDDHEPQAKKIAGYASQAGNLLASKANGEAVASMARGKASGAASDEIQQWLSRFGTARVQLDVDKNFSLKNSQLDLLVPFYEHMDTLAFTQGSLHRTDGRTQANLGAGLRHFTPTYMLGGNLFGDYDLSQGHMRAGGGAEYWRDFLKLGVNGYLGLTGWKDAPDLAGYQARPASGWDIRAQAWLPALPQLGGKLIYEQYYGNEVGLFGAKTRQKNPYAFTSGLNYTPIPLVTLGAEQRTGQSGKSDSRFTLDLTYRPGVPWRHQVNPAAVAALRSLAGSRHDLVERNNNIVLEYRKKADIRLRAAGLITGYAGEQKSLQVSVTSTHRVSHIDWDAPGLFAAGGKIVQIGADYAVLLPSYSPSRQEMNIYTVNGVAVDSKGNRSGRSNTQVTVLPTASVTNPLASTFTPASSVLPADGTSTQVLTLSLKDENSQPLDLDLKEIGLTSSALKSATVSGFTQQSAGVFTATLTAGVDAETVTLTPSVSGTALAPAKVTIVRTLPDAGQSLFTPGPATIPADNVAVSTLTLVMKDARGNALTGLKDSLTLEVKDAGGNTPAAGAITASGVTESSTQGTYTATLQGTLAGKYVVVPWHNGAAIPGLSAEVTLLAGAPDNLASTFTPGPATIPADSVAVSTLTLVMKDARGNAVTGLKDSLTLEIKDALGNTPPVGTITASAIAESSTPGTYTASLQGTLAGKYVVVPWYNGAAIGSLSAEVTLLAGAPAGLTSTFTPGPATIPADNLAASTLTLVMKDARGNVLTGLKDSLTLEVRDAGGNAPAAAITVSGVTESSTQGTYTASLQGTQAGKYVVVPWYNGAAIPGLSAEVTLLAVPNQAMSGITVDKSNYTAGDEMTITVTVKDAQGNPMPGVLTRQDLNTKLVVDGLLDSAVRSFNDNQDGTYTIKVQVTKASKDPQAIELKLNSWVKRDFFSVKPAASQRYNVFPNKHHFVLGEDIRFTILSSDKYGNGTACLEHSEVIASFATFKDFKCVDELTKIITLTASEVGTDLKLIVQLWGVGGRWDYEVVGFDITAATP
ncbi:inverse autotransporter beta domain-containing protein [Cedecea neteri]|uniref:inverse autotransporter beta domain-containing protein n=1 Tax=Cedecea neteri TaxID=158822 RepID=UPI002AA81D34|nr:inverse autotransporter beta domain-containing protein [Cedecea neteri]WPU21987.1 inverse autotransporter beta domain-containing protein [Cedecea neteri]